MTFPSASIKVEGKAALTVNGSFDVVEKRRVDDVVVVLHDFWREVGFLTWNAETPNKATMPRTKVDLNIITVLPKTCQKGVYIMRRVQIKTIAETNLNYGSSRERDSTTTVDGCVMK